jgi:hypothetical protein
MKGRPPRSPSARHTHHGYADVALGMIRIRTLDGRIQLLVRVPACLTTRPPLGPTCDLAASGFRAEDIFYLTFQELHDVVQTNHVDDQLIGQRKEAFREYQALTPPRVLTSDGEIIAGAYRREDVPAGALVGLVPMRKRRTPRRCVKSRYPARQVGSGSSATLDDG